MSTYRQCLLFCTGGQGDLSACTQILYGIMKFTFLIINVCIISTLCIYDKTNQLYKQLSLLLTFYIFCYFLCLFFKRIVVQLVILSFTMKYYTIFEIA